MWPKGVLFNFLESEPNSTYSTRTKTDWKQRLLVFIRSFQLWEGYLKFWVFVKDTIWIEVYMYFLIRKSSPKEEVTHLLWFVYKHQYRWSLLKKSKDFWEKYEMLFNKRIPVIWFGNISEFMQIHKFQTTANLIMNTIFCLIIITC